MAFVKAHVTPTHPGDRKFTDSTAYDFYMGIELNPRLGEHFDLKLFTNGRAGMMTWTLIDVSNLALQHRNGTMSTSLILVTFLHSIYVVDFFANESWYLRTIDITHDHYGFYLAWGCFTWLPTMYTLQAQYLGRYPTSPSPAYLAVTFSLGLLGYYIFRRVNAQKDLCRRTSGDCLIWGEPARFIVAPYRTSDGTLHKSLLLCSGWWGVSRHANYTGDLLLSFSMCAVAGTTTLLVWFYAIFMTGLLLHRHYWETLFFDDKLFLAPIGNSPQRVLDVGTGTGIWAIDFADEFPSSEVIGVDISPIQPIWIPPNCKFQIDDIEQPWTWSEDSFDFIHIRHLEASVSDWPALYTQAFDHLKPGGYIEIKEFEIGHRSLAYGDNLPEDHIHNRTTKIMLQAAAKLGKPLTQTRDHGVAKALRAAGFVDIVGKRWTIPIGCWPADPKLKEVGQCNWKFIDQSFEGFCLFLLKEVMGWEYEKIVVFVEENRQALRDLRLQSFQYLHVVYARKPESAEE
ncbi:7-dehydrocholesterol reductase [Colletotrichum trifolii]|uniref:7-dehydrocholesterol reductase n=1 Tax=Colletotrichum trifolii TaxID=5466 RepID=A0A4R8PVJ8_COLTR|nr:7-dehydrocholesterol reductase [Colletotrichum trifolii]